jgi:hypothetical protein
MKTDDMSKKTGQLNISLPPELVVTLDEIRAKHGLNGTEIARRLLESVAEFYRLHGYFSFPVRLWPEAEFLTAVINTQETAADRARLAKSEAARKKKEQPDGNRQAAT